jgi:hypothetical protein
MALAPAFHELTARLDRLREALLALRVTVAEDRPLAGEALLVDQLDEAVEEAVGYLEEAVGAAGQGKKAVEAPVDLERARTALAACHAKVNLFGRRLCADLLGFERIAGLRRLARRRGGEWPPWALSVQRGAEACRQPLHEVHEALLDCWQEVAERSAAVSVHAVGIGRQVVIAGRAEATPETAETS